MDKLILHELRQSVNNHYVGFYPTGGTVKPVHISNGLFRVIYGLVADTSGIAQLSYVATNKGKVPPGNEMSTVWNALVERDAIDTKEISEQDLNVLRNMLQKLISVDDGVFGVDSMVAYSAGSKYFIARDATLQDAGEFIGGIIKEFCSPLADCIYSALDDDNDPITLLFAPVLGKIKDDKKYGNILKHSEIIAFQNRSPALEKFCSTTSTAAACLTEHLELYPNKLSRLRFASLFAIFSIIRYLASLEAIYCGANIRPMLLDFSNNSQSSIAKDSNMCYTQIHKSITNFYFWAFVQELKRRNYTSTELYEQDTPVYKAVSAKKKVNSKPKATREELVQLWNSARENASEIDDEETALFVYGEAIYDMLALEASAQPINYFNQLGKLSGLLWPPTNFHSNKRFAVTEDILEMMLRCCVRPEETITLAELKNRLWDRFGVIIGGSQKDQDILLGHGSIFYSDLDSMSANSGNFVKMLEDMNFAEVMADGILQIRLGGQS